MSAVRRLTLRPPRVQKFLEFVEDHVPIQGRKAASWLAGEAPATLAGPDGTSRWPISSGGALGPFRGQIGASRHAAILAAPEPMKIHQAVR
jgi:hypothetical protein